MKKICLLLTIAVQTLTAMQEPKSRHLLLSNGTDWNVDVKYQSDGKELSRQVPKREEIALNNPETIKQLQVFPSGDLWSFFKVFTPPNEAAKIQDQLRKYATGDVILNVSLPERIGGSYASFIVSAVPEQELSQLIAKEALYLKKYFPKVDQVINESKGMKGLFGFKPLPVEERHFFELGENPSKDSINAVYEQKRKLFQKIAGAGQTQSAGERARAEDALTLINLAYDILMQEAGLKEKKDQLQKLTNELIRTPKKY